MFIQGHIFILLPCLMSSLLERDAHNSIIPHKVDDLYTLLPINPFSFSVPPFYIPPEKSLLLFSSTLLYPPREPFMCMDVNEISLNNDEDMHS